MEQQSEQSTGIVRTAVLAVEAVRQHQRLQVCRAERAIEEFAEAAGRECDEVRDLAPFHSTKLQAEAQQFAKARESTALQVRRRLHEQRLEVARQFAEMNVQRQEAI